MGGGDKALRTLGGETLLSRVVARARPQVRVLALNANGDPARFSAFALVPGDRALALLAAWSRRGADPGELRELPAAVERLIRSGTLPAQAAITVTAAITGNPGDAATVSGKSDMAPGHLKGDRPPVSPGAGPPPGKGHKTSHPGKG